jgi:hypothetical protein
VRVRENPAPDADRARRVNRLRFLARVMDSCIELPGTNQRIGLDPIIGLVPGVGDLVTTAVALYIVYEGRKLGATNAQLTSMLGNVAIDMAVGAVPVLGDAFDFAFTANQRNLRILGIEDAGVRIKIDPVTGFTVQ